MPRNPKFLHQQNKKTLEIEDRRKVVAANMLAGATYRDIAAELGVSTGTIANDFKQILKHWRKHYTRDIDEWVKIQLRRLDVLINAIWEDARNGDKQAIDRVLKLMERQEKLLGIDVSRIDVTSEGKPLQHVQMLEIIKDYAGKQATAADTPAEDDSADTADDVAQATPDSPAALVTDIDLSDESESGARETDASDDDASTPD